jgi:hypothetical protein
MAERGAVPGYGREPSASVIEQEASRLLDYRNDEIYSEIVKGESA